MPLPLAPIVALSLRYGTVAIATYTIARRIERGRRDQRAEDSFDETPEGVTLRREAEQVNATGRMRRVFRFSTSGPGIEIDATALGRVRFRKV